MGKNNPPKSARGLEMRFESSSPIPRLPAGLKVGPKIQGSHLEAPVETEPHKSSAVHRTFGKNGTPKEQLVKLFPSTSLAKEACWGEEAPSLLAF